MGLRWVCRIIGRAVGEVHEDRCGWPDRCSASWLLVEPVLRETEFDAASDCVDQTDGEVRTVRNLRLIALQLLGLEGCGN